MHPRHHHGGGRRPNIGVTPDFTTKNDFGYYELKVPYADAVFRAGGLPFLLAYSDDTTCVDAYLDRLSGLVVTGGAFDIPPEAYGETAREGLGTLKSSRTNFETALLKGALARNLPVLGVCGGMQLLNVVLGGSLFQDIRRELERANDHEQKHDRTQPHHPIEVKDGSLLADVLGKGQVMVNSTHHQAVKRLGDKVVACAVSPDGVIEGIEAPSYEFALGVQWHPELMLDTLPAHFGVYRAFVQRAKDTRR
jgi:putative glutamine amidotransferase